MKEPLLLLSTCSHDLVKKRLLLLVRVSETFRELSRMASNVNWTIKKWTTCPLSGVMVSGNTLSNQKNLCNVLKSIAARHSRLGELLHQPLLCCAGPQRCLLKPKGTWHLPSVLSSDQVRLGKWTWHTQPRLCVFEFTTGLIHNTDKNPMITNSMHQCREVQISLGGLGCVPAGCRNDQANLHIQRFT